MYKTQPGSGVLWIIEVVAPARPVITARRTIQSEIIQSQGPAACVPAHLLSFPLLRGLINPLQEVLNTVERVQRLGEHQPANRDTGYKLYHRHLELYGVLHFVADFFAFLQNLHQHENLASVVDVV